MSSLLLNVIMATLLPFFFTTAVTSQFASVNFTDTMMKQFENFRLDESFDPFILEKGSEFKYNKSSQFRALVNIEPGLQVRGIRQLSLQDVDVRLFLLSARLNITTKYLVERIRLDGLYKLKGKAMGFLPVNGDGPFWVEMHKISGFLNMSITFNGTQFAVEELHHELEFETLKHYFRNLFASGLSWATNQLVNSFSTQVVYKALVKNENAKRKLRAQLKKKIDIRLKKTTDSLKKSISKVIGFSPF